MTDFPDKSEKDSIKPRQPDEWLIEVADGRTLRQAHERQAARVRLLWSKRRFLLRVAVCGLAIGIVFALVYPKSYQSTADLMPPDQSSGVGALVSALSGGSGSSRNSGGGILSSIGGSLAGMATSALGMKSTGNLFIGILESRTVQDDLIHKFNLQEIYGKHYMKATRRALAKHTRISQDPKSGIISITVTDHDPKRAAAMAKEYVKELNWVVTNLNTSSAHRERVFLDQRLKQVKANLETAEKQFSQFASQKGAIDVPEQGKALVVSAASLQGELILAQAELKSMQQIYTNNNVTVRSLQAQVDELRGQLEKIGGKDANDPSSTQELFPSLRKLPLLGVTYADLLRRAKVEEMVFEVLTQEDEIAKVQEAKDTPSVEVLDPPRVPKHQSFPSLMLSMILSATLALVVGCAWVLAGSAWKSADPNDPRKVVAMEVWGDVHAGLPWNSGNGSPNGGLKHWLRKRFRLERQEGSGD